MPTIVQILSDYREQLPEWLASDSPPGFDRREFFASRTLYYPGSGDDGQPVKLCALSHAAHNFIYVDYGVDRNTLVKRLNDPERGFRGYRIAHEEQVSEDVLRPGGWTPHVAAGDVRDSTMFADSFVKPFGWFVVLDRKGGGEDHGPRRLAHLFIGGDGFASYDALYCQADGTPPPFLAVIQDHGFGGNWDRFDRAGLLDRIARRRGVQPKFLLIGGGSEPWSGYEDTGGVPEPGGGGPNPRRLFRRAQS